MDLGKANWKILWKEFTIADAIKNYSADGKRSNAALTIWVWNMFISNHHGMTWKDFKTSLEEITADMLETLREAVWEMEPEHDNKLLKYHDKTLMDEELLLMGE